MSRSDEPNVDQTKSPAYRARLFVVVVLILIGISLAVAVLETGAITGVALAAVVALPVLIVVITLIAFAACVANHDGYALFALIVVLSLGFLLSVALSFALPERARLESLTTLLGLVLAFVGFLTSASGEGLLKINFKRDETNNIHINLQLNMGKQSGSAEGQ